MTDFYIHLYLNHIAYEKTSSSSDVIKITVNPNDASPESIEFLISYKQSFTNTLKVYTKNDLLNYLEGVFHLLKMDKAPFHSVDLIMTCHPSTKLFISDIDQVIPMIRQAIQLFV